MLEPNIVRSVQAYIEYLIESNVQNICLSPKAVVDSHPDKQAIEFDLSQKRLKLSTIEKELSDCRRCSLSKDRNHIVFGHGNPSADIFFIGDIPSYEMDQRGKFFEGEMGELLTNIIEKGMNTACSDIYFCHTVKCRPVQERELKIEEIQACFPFLIKQIEVVKPKVIVLLGFFPAQILLQTSEPIEQLRGKWHTYKGIPVMPTFHPTYVLQNYTVPIRKKVWDDVKKAKQFVESGQL